MNTIKTVFLIIKNIQSKEKFFKYIKTKIVFIFSFTQDKSIKKSVCLIILEDCT